MRMIAADHRILLGDQYLVGRTIFHHPRRLATRFSAEDLLELILLFLFCLRKRSILFPTSMATHLFKVVNQRIDSLSGTLEQ